MNEPRNGKTIPTAKRLLVWALQRSTAGPQRRIVRAFFVRHGSFLFSWENVCEDHDDELVDAAPAFHGFLPKYVVTKKANDQLPYDTTHHSLPFLYRPES